MYEILKTLPYCLQLIVIFIPTISLAIAAASFFLSWREARKRNKLTRANIITDFFQTLLSDEMMQEAFYIIEYDKFEYNKDFHKSKNEEKIDRLLRHFSNIALLHKNKLVSSKDIEHIKYYIIRVMGNTEIKKYIQFLENWTKRSGINGHPLLSLKELYEELIKSA